MVKFSTAGTIWTSWIEWSSFRLWNFLHKTKHFRCRSLVKACLRAEGAERVENFDNSHRIDVSSIDREFPRCANKALRGQVVELINFEIADHTENVVLLGQIELMQLNLVRDTQKIQACRFRL